MPYRINGKIQHYAWGGFDYLPSLLHLPNTRHQPFAEYWLGAHPKAASGIRVKDDLDVPLNTFIAENPQQYLGAKVVSSFGRLPYLFKVLDVHDMLSIQVHPSKAEAEKGFARENAAGIPADAPYRNYKDDNHKPEMMVALSTFYLLHGFLEADALTRQLENTPELKTLLPVFKGQDYKALYRHVMNMPQKSVNEMLTPLLQRILPLYEAGQLSKENPDFWAARTCSSGMTSWENIDRGIFSIYFFNLLRLQPGEGIFQAAGIPHAYLEGQNIELMANSDNVLRGGLTPKHVDVEELLKHIVFKGITPHIIKKQEDQALTLYPCSVPDFALTQIRLKAGEALTLTSYSVEILLVISGKATIRGSQTIKLIKGDAALMTAEETLVLQSEEDVLIYKAGVPEK